MLQWGQLPGSPVVKTLPSVQGARVRSPGLGNKIPHAVKCSHSKTKWELQLGLEMSVGVGWGGGCASMLLDVNFVLYEQQCGSG